MTTQYVKIKGKEYEVRLARFRDEEFFPGRRNTVTILTELSYAEAKELFTNPGEWSVINRYAPMVGDDGEVIQLPDKVIDCAAYEILCYIKDPFTGVLEVVMGKPTAEELLAILTGESV